MARSTLTKWQRFKLIVKVVEVRLRFVAVLVATALVIGYWDTISNYWQKWTRPAAVASRALDPDHEYYCPMHPQVVRPEREPNGEVPKCPICGMPLSLRRRGEKAPLPEGVTGRVQLSPERIQLAGVQSVEVGYRAMSKETTTLGNVAYDETRLSRVTSRVSGYVEKLYVDQTYIPVHEGDLLAEIYSPELYSSAQELLVASKSNGLADLARSARRRLELLGVSPKDIDAIVASGEARPTLKIRSPRSGLVIGKPIVAGSRVEEGMTLLEIADLSRVWIEADVFADDISLVSPGDRITATVPSLIRRTFAGRVALVYPQVDPALRTIRVRFEVENPNLELRPGMFATVEINTPLDRIEPFRSAAKAGGGPPPGEVLAVPERSVIDTGTKQIVYIEREPGLFEGVEIAVGPRVGDYYPVVRGLEAGQRVAAAGAFLVDAETRLNPGAAGTYFGASGGPQVASAGDRGSMQSREAQQVESQPTANAPANAEKPIPPEALRNIAKLPSDDQPAARQQRYCPITGLALGSMGVPVKLVLHEKPVFLCCSGCIQKAKADPDKTLKRAKELSGQQSAVSSQ